MDLDKSNIQNIGTMIWDICIVGLWDRSSHFGVKSYVKETEEYVAGRVCRLTIPRVVFRVEAPSNDGIDYKI